jgi:hypothetical protein
VNHRRGLYLLVLFLTIILTYEKATAQMAVGYPQRFYLTGLIELSYRDYSIEITGSSRKFEGGYSTFEQHYQVGLAGYIYHPRLIVFTSKFDYIYSIYKNDFSTHARDLGYDIDLTFLPYRPISLELYASKSDYTIEGITSASMEASTDQYGAKLRLINFWKLPPIKAEYYHTDTNYFSSLTVPPKLETEGWNFSIEDNLKPLRTAYGFSFGFADVLGPDPLESYSTRYINGNTVTNIRDTRLSTYFSSLNEEFSKRLDYGIILLPRPGKRFYQDYRYDNYNYEFHLTGIRAMYAGEEIIRTTDQLFSGAWGYKFTERLYGSLSLEYGQHKEGTGFTEITNEKKWTYYSAVPSFDYRRPIAGFDFSSHYVYFFRKDEQRGELKEHDVELGLETRRFRLGTIYVNYDFLKSDSIDRLFATEEDLLMGGEFKESTAKSTVHLVRIGVRGRLGRIVGRAYWNIEGQYLYASSSGKRPITTENEERMVSWSRKTGQYTLFGELSYPVGKGGTLSLRAGYTNGENDSTGEQLKKVWIVDSFVEEFMPWSYEQMTRRFYFSERFSYPITRRLFLSAWWQQIWDKIEGGTERKIRDYDVLLTYRLGMVFFSLEYEGIREEEDSITRDSKRLFLILRRPFY